MFTFEEKKQTTNTGYPLSKTLNRGDILVVRTPQEAVLPACVINIAINMASHQIPVAVFSSPEKSAEHITEKFISTLAGFEDENPDADTVSAHQWERIASAINQIADYPIFLDDTPVITVSDMKAKIHRINQNPETNNIGLVIVDNFQLMCSGRQVQEILCELKVLSRELDLIVIIISPQDNLCSTDTTTDTVVYI